MIMTTLPQYMVKKRGMVKKEVNKMIGITDAFDCEWSLCVLYFVMLDLYYSCIQNIAHFVNTCNHCNL